MNSNDLKKYSHVFYFCLSILYLSCFPLFFLKFWIRGPFGPMAIVNIHTVPPVPRRFPAGSRGRKSHPVLHRLDRPLRFPLQLARSATFVDPTWSEPAPSHQATEGKSMLEKETADSNMFWHSNNVNRFPEGRICVWELEPRPAVVAQRI